MAVHIPSIPATFIHIPKTAGSSFSDYLVKHFDHTHTRSTHCLVAEARTYWPNLGHTFCFVRNPWDRMVSYYMFIGQRAQQRQIDRGLGLEVKKTTNAELDQEIVKYFSQGFNYWINDIYHQRDNPFELYNTHHQRSTPQTHWSQDVDHIFRIEDFATRWHEVEEFLGIQGPLDKRNTSDHMNYREYYTDTSQHQVAEMFAYDIKAYGYSYD